MDHYMGHSIVTERDKVNEKNQPSEVAIPSRPTLCFQVYEFSLKLTIKVWSKE
jgi:hypothetical protein